MAGRTGNGRGTVRIVGGRKAGRVAAVAMHIGSGRFSCVGFGYATAYCWLFVCCSAGGITKGWFGEEHTSADAEGLGRV